MESISFVESIKAQRVLIIGETRNQNNDDIGMEETLPISNSNNRHPFYYLSILHINHFKRRFNFKEDESNKDSKAYLNNSWQLFSTIETNKVVIELIYTLI